MPEIRKSCNTEECCNRNEKGTAIRTPRKTLCQLNLGHSDLFMYLRTANSRIILVKNGNEEQHISNKIQVRASGSSRLDRQNNGTMSVHFSDYLDSL